MKIKIALAIPLAGLAIAATLGAWWWYGNIRLTDDSLAAVKKKGFLTVGTDIPFGMMEFFDENNRPAGLDIDIIREIARRLEVEPEIKDYDWDNLFLGVKEKEVDLAISGITITPARQEEMLFSNPYFNGGQVILVRSDNRDIKGVIDLAGRRIATQKDTTGFNEAKKYTAESLIYTYLNFDVVGGSVGIIDDLKAGKFEVIIVDYNQALDMIKKYPGLKIVGAPFTKEDYGIITSLGNDSLMRKVNSILREMEKDGTLNEIVSRWTKF